MPLVNSDDIDLGTIIIDESIGQSILHTQSKLVTPFEADFDKCPRCGSENLFFGECEPEALFVYRTHNCNDCELSWTERYDLVQVHLQEG